MDSPRDAEAQTLAEVADGDEEEALTALAKVKAASDPLRIAGAVLGGIGAYALVRVGVKVIKDGASGCWIMSNSCSRPLYLKYQVSDCRT